MAQVAVLLISADFMASDFIATDELPLLLAAAEQKGVVILPLIVSPSRFEKTGSLSCFQSVNPPSKPLIGLERAKQEEILVKLTEDILSALKGQSSGVRSTKPTSRRQVSNPPMSRNAYFTGREDILEALRAGFMSGQSTQALSGLGGVGKTQTALEYAYRYEDHYRFVLWAKAHTRESLTTDFIMLAALLNLPEKDEQDQTITITALKRWLDSHSDWLLVLDNADDLAMAREFLPTRKTGHILLTTRAQNTKPIAVPHEVEKMNSREGALFLLSRLGEIKKGDSLDSAPAALRDEAEALSTDLDGLPLALDQAAAFIEEQPSTLEEYRQLYEKARGQLLNRRGDLAYDHPSVTVTFSLAFDKVANANPAAADLLRVCAFLQADAIPEEIFAEGAMELGEALSAVMDSPLGLSDVFKEAGRFSLLKRHLNVRTVSVHRLVQAVLKEEMGEDDKKLWAERAVHGVNAVFPEVEHSNWPTCERLIAHAEGLAAVINDYGFEFWESALLLNLAGVYLSKRAQYNEAEPLLEQSLAIWEKSLGAEHPYTATSLNNLAKFYYTQGRYEKAEPLYARALAILEKALGAEHPHTVACLNNLAVLYESQGRYEKAEPLHERALAIREKVLGTNHPDTATSLNNLAGLYKSQGRYEKVEPLYEQALAISEKALGAEHPDTATSLNNLAGLYESQGRYENAEPLYLRALAIREKALGAEHPDMAGSLNNLANLYHSQGRYERAEPLHERALAIIEKTLGAEHPDTAMSLNNLAGLYESQGRYEKAKPLYERALAISEKALGAEHPDTATSLNNLAGLYDLQGNSERAEPLYTRALAISEKALGPAHPHTGGCLNNLASLYQLQGSYEKAEPLYVRALAIKEKALGAEHPDMATSLNNLAVLYDSQESYEKAEPLYLRALAISEKVLGTENPYTAAILNSLALLYESQGKYEKAAPLFERALSIREKTLGAEHLDTAGSLNNLAGLYCSQGRYESAEPLMRRGILILLRASAEMEQLHPYIMNALKRYYEILIANGQDEEAARETMSRVFAPE